MLDFVERRRVLADVGGESLTKQSDALESDVNQIMNRYVRSGELPSARQAVYGDFDDALDFYEAQNRVAAGKTAFALLPAHIRDHCKNDLGVFLDLVHDPAGRADLKALGLSELQVPETAKPVEPVPALEDAHSEES